MTKEKEFERQARSRIEELSKTDNIDHAIKPQDLEYLRYAYKHSKKPEEKQEQQQQEKQQEQTVDDILRSNESLFNKAKEYANSYQSLPNESKEHLQQLNELDVIKRELQAAQQDKQVSQDEMSSTAQVIDNFLNKFPSYHTLKNQTPAQDRQGLNQASSKRRDQGKDPEQAPKIVDDHTFNLGQNIQHEVSNHLTSFETITQKAKQFNDGDNILQELGYRIVSAVKKMINTIGAALSKGQNEQQSQQHSTSHTLKPGIFEKPGNTKLNEIKERVESAKQTFEKAKHKPQPSQGHSEGGNNPK